MGKLIEFKFKAREPLPYKERPFLCKIGLHESATLWNGTSYFVGCRCCKKIL